MGVHSGKFGVVNGVSTVRNWTIADVMAPQPYVASNTLFGTGRVKGIEEWNGSYQSFGGQPVIMPGVQQAFVGYTAPDDDSTGNGLKYTGDCLIESCQITWNWGGGEILNVTSNFKGHLALTFPTGVEIFDVTVPTVPPVGCTKVQVSSDGVSFADVPNLVQAQLTLSCALQEYVNSSSAVDCRLWKGQKAGPIDWTMSLTQQETERTQLLKGNSYVWRLFINATEYYELKWGLVHEFSGITVDRQTGAIIQRTVNVSMDGFDPAETTFAAATGHVLLPDATQWWPGEEPGTGT